jgi:hypothetical protein
MPKRFDGSGVVKLQCSEGTFAALKLSQMPIPRDWGEIRNGFHFVTVDTREMGADSERYRVIWPERSNGPGSKLRSSSFSLGTSHTNETLFVLAEFLRVQGVDFIALANRHGNAFTTAGLSGSGLAYVPGTHLHSVLTNSDLFVKPLPKDGSLTRLQVH